LTRQITEGTLTSDERYSTISTAGVSSSPIKNDSQPSAGLIFPEVSSPPIGDNCFYKIMILYTCVHNYNYIHACIYIQERKTFRM